MQKDLVMRFLSFKPPYPLIHPWMVGAEANLMIGRGTLLPLPYFRKFLRDLEDLMLGQCVVEGSLEHNTSHLISD